VRRTPVLLATAALLAACAAALGFFWPFGNHQEVLRLPGIVEIQEVRLGSKVAGRVLKILTKEGKTVEPGDALVIFDVPEVEAQLKQAEAKLAAAAADWEKAEAGPRLEEKQAAWATAEAAKARYERMLAGWRTEEKEQARSDLEAADADLKQAREDLVRAMELYRQRAAAKAEYDAALAARDRAQGRFNSARARYEMMEAGNRKEDKETARAEWKQAEWQAKLLDAGTRPEDKAAAKARMEELRARVEELKVNQREQTVYAPERAVVEVLSVRKGDLVQPNAPVVRVLRAEDLWVKVYVPETELGKVRLNQVVDVRIDSYPDKRFRGTVEQVASISEFTPRNVQSADERRLQVFGVKVRVTNPQGAFKAGMFAEVVIPLQGVR
jgi:multidrug resistance efflux pump